MGWVDFMMEENEKVGVNKTLQKTFKTNKLK